MKGVDSLRKLLLKEGFQFYKANTESEYYKNPKFPRTIRVSDHVSNTLSDVEYITIVKDNSTNKYLLFIDRQVKSYSSYLELKRALKLLLDIYDEFPGFLKFIKETNKTYDELLDDANKTINKQNTQIEKLSSKINTLLTEAETKLSGVVSYLFNNYKEGQKPIIVNNKIQI